MAASYEGPLIVNSYLDDSQQRHHGDGHDEYEIALDAATG
jgi:hypothetical protein